MAGLGVHSEPMTTPRTITIDPRPHLTAAGGSLLGLIERIDPDQVSLPTPSTDMNVAQLFSHLIMAIERLGSAGRGDDLSTWAVSGPQVGVEHWAQTCQQAVDAANLAWVDDQRLDAEIVLPWTTLRGADVVAVYVNEIVVHGWELAAAIGTPVTWSDEAIEVAEQIMHSQLPDADRGPMWAEISAHLPEGVPWEDPFANAVEVGPDATSLERLVAWNGRDPHWSPA